tara:strand:- start:266 stop:517 length:252 start_codon:yes stop_codon:yes gene_type:complete
MKLHEQRDNLEKLLDETQEELDNIINWMNHAPKFKVYQDSREHMDYGIDVHYGVREAIERLARIKNSITRLELQGFRIVEDEE